MVIDGNVLDSVVTFIQSAIDAFGPLLWAVIGVFLAFAIAEKLRYYITKAVKK